MAFRWSPRPVSKGARLFPVLVALMLGCERGPTRDEVVLRLDAGYFTTDAPLERASTVRIAGAVRTVPYRREGAVSSVVRSSAARHGRVVANVTVPAEAVGLPASAFRLGFVLGLDAAPLDGPDPDAQRLFMGTAVRLRSDWSLHVRPGAPRRGKVVASLPSVADGSPALLQLRAFHPAPHRLESRPFDVPVGGTVALGYGLANPLRAPAGTTVCFRATLDCAWSWARTILSDCVRAGEPGQVGWYDAATRMRWGGRQCRLQLAIDGHGPDAGDPAWSVPRIRAPVADDPRTGTNVVLVSLDTLRADHLNGYGYVRPTAPVLQSDVMRRGTTFADASTTYPMTNSAHLGIFTGLYPAALPANGTLPASRDVRVLTELLADAGFTTIGFTEDALVSSEYGFGAGFDELTEFHPDSSDRARLVIARGREALRANRRRRFFLFLHTYKVHEPYEPSPPFRGVFKLRIPPNWPGFVGIPERYWMARDAYDESIRQLDELLSGLWGELDQTGLADRTLLVVLSDHGEAFGEHGLPGHGYSPHQEALNVPLIFRGPGVSAGRHVATPVSLVDVAPTILDMVGLPVPPSMQGRSLRPALAGGDLEPRPLFFAWIGARNRGVRSGEWKLVKTGEQIGLLNLRADPLEKQLLSDGRGGTAELVRALDEYDSEGERRRASLGAKPGPPSIAPDVARALRALGYVP